jgi:phosphohistidine phosphatase SixA
MRLTRRSFAAILLLPATARAEDGPPWQSVRTGAAAVIMRHAIAPGGGDPPGFRREECATQRNLSEEGRAQARRIGVLLRGNGVIAATVRTSAWCRARETATLLGLGPATHEPALDSFFGDRGEGPARTEALRALLAAWRGGPLVMVTHQVNITALTTVFPASGEMVIVRTGGAPDVLGRLRT